MNESVGLLVALTAGVLSFLSPCVLPLVPSYLSFVTGMSLEDLQEGVDRKATLMHSLLFVTGFSLIFITLGASASFLGSFLRYYEVWIARIGGAVIIVLGLHLTGVFRIAPLMRERRVHVSDKPAGYIGTIGVGAAFGARLDALHWPRPRGDPDPGRNPGHGLGRRKSVERLLVGAGHSFLDCRVGSGLVLGRVLPLPPVLADGREGVRGDTHPFGSTSRDRPAYASKPVPYHIYAGLGLGEDLASNI